PGLSQIFIDKLVRTLSSKQISEAGAAKRRHQFEALIQADECGSQNGQFYDQQLTTIKYECDDEWQNRGKEVAARSFQEKIWEGERKHRGSEQAPERRALKKYQNPKEGCDSIKEVTRRGDHESGRRSFDCSTPPHGRARARVNGKQCADHV